MNKWFVTFLISSHPRRMFLRLCHASHVVLSTIEQLHLVESTLSINAEREVSFTLTPSDPQMSLTFCKDFTVHKTGTQNDNFSQHKRYKCFSVSWVWLIFADIKLVTKLCCQRLVEEHIKDNEPPGERQTAENQTQRDVDQQLSEVMWAWHQLEPAALRRSVSQRLHCSWKTTNRKYIRPHSSKKHLNYPFKQRQLTCLSSAEPGQQDHGLMLHQWGPDEKCTSSHMKPVQLREEGSSP